MANKNVSVPWKTLKLLETYADLLITHLENGGPPEIAVKWVKDIKDDINSINGYGSK